MVNTEEIVINQADLITVPSEPYNKLVKENARQQREARQDATQQSNELTAKITQAEDQLLSAEQALTQGRERGAGDFIARQGGGTRPSPAYLERVDRLEQARDEAYQNLVNLRKQKAKL